MLNTTFLLIFILAHIVSDYLLQTDAIAKKKAESNKGVLLHSLVVILVQVIMLSGFGMRGVLAAIIGGVIHFLIDIMKLRFGSRLKNIQFIYYLLDQMAHIASILILTYYLAPKTSDLSQYEWLIKYFISFVLIVSVSTVTVKMFVRDLFPSLKEELFFKKNERVVDAVTTFALFAIWFVQPIFSILIGAVILGFYIYIERRFFHYKIAIASTKYVILLLFGFLAW